MQRAIAIETREGGSDVSMSRLNAYQGMSQNTFATTTEDGEVDIQTTWAPIGTNQGFDFTITSQGDFLTELGVKQVNYFTGPDANKRQEIYDVYLQEDKNAIADKSLLFLPKDLRENAVELRNVYDKMDQLRDPIKLYLNYGEGDVEEIVNQLEKLEKEGNKIINENKKITGSRSTLYDYNTGEFVKEAEAQEGLVSETNGGTEKYQYTSYHKLEDLRYQKSMELIYLAGKAYDDMEAIFYGEGGWFDTNFMSKGGNTQFLKDAIDPSGEEGIAYQSGFGTSPEALELGAQAISFLGGKDITTYSFKQFYEEFTALQDEGIDITRDQAGFMYDQYMLQQVSIILLPRPIKQLIKKIK